MTLKDSVQAKKKKKKRKKENIPPVIRATISFGQNKSDVSSLLKLASVYCDKVNVGLIQKFLPPVTFDIDFEHLG